jgi:sulfite exporter TauE/SafE
MVKSEFRATVSSIESLLRKLVYALLGPIIGLVTDKYSIAWAFIFTGLFFLIASLALITRLLKSS